MDDRLDWNVHINHIRGKLSIGVYALTKCCRTQSIYAQFKYPILQYVFVIWNHIVGISL